MVRAKWLATGPIQHLLMARFDVFSAQRSTLLVDVRADQLEMLGNLVLIPLLPRLSARRTTQKLP